MAIRNLSSAQIFDCGQAQERGLSTGYKRTIRNDDGELVTVKLCQRPSVKIVDPAGNVGQLALTNGAGDRNTNSPYSQYIKQSKLAKGFILYGVCPLRSYEEAQNLPKAMRNDKPCSDASDKKACKHVEEIIKRRQAKQTERNEERERALRNTDREASQLAYSNQKELLELLQKSRGAEKA